MQKLTPKQENILEFIKKFVDQKNENPTSYAIHKEMNNQGQPDSLKSVTQVVEALEKKDLIKRDAKRKIYLIKNDSYANLKNIFSIPVYGLASCGDALAYANDEVDGYLQLSKSLFNKEKTNKLFAVKALGDSMDKDSIEDGDYVIFEKYDNQDDLEGKIVVVVINGMATIKRFKKVEKGLIGLFPNSSNSFHQPIYIHENDSVLIAGIFKRVFPVAFTSL
jgi:SOS-response transcriptional repressor LexA